MYVNVQGAIPVNSIGKTVNSPWQTETTELEVNEEVGRALIDISALPTKTLPLQPPAEIEVISNNPASDVVII